MKRILYLLLFLTSSLLQAQSDMTGFSYQAVVRSADGNALVEKSVEITVELYTKSQTNPLYIENHFVETDRFGQLNIVIGSGEIIEGNLALVPWSEGAIYYKIQLQNDDEELDIISEAQLLAVPYAYHAKTADQLSHDFNDDSNGRMDIREGKFWTTIGNLVDARNNKFGTLNEESINLVTNDETRVIFDPTGTMEVHAQSNFLNGVKMRQDLSVDGNVLVQSDQRINGGLVVDQEGHFGQSITTFADLTVYGNTRLNASLDVGGSVVFNSNFKVAQMGSTTLTGTLDVGKATSLGDILTVAEATQLNSTLDVVDNTTLDADLSVAGNTDMTGTLDVGGNTNMTGTLDVRGNTALASDLNVTGDADFDATMDIEGATTITNTLSVTENVNDGNYVASFYNTNSGNGDGIHIKLGKDRTNLAPPNIPAILSQAEIDAMKNLLRCDFPNTNKLNILRDIVIEGTIQDIQVLGGLAIGVGNFMINFINANLGLPINIPKGFITPKIDLLYLPMPSIAGVGIPDVDVDLPAMPPVDLPLVPSIPTINLGAIGIQEIPITDLNFWGVPNICLNDAPGSTPLNNENEFIRFSDNSNTKMGSIRAVSVADWSENYLTPSFLFKLKGALNSAIDKKHARYHFIAEVSTALKDYFAIGVEYSSGNGDYAEWLERADINERIVAGDIVGVVGGKISRDITNAEQVMVVSHNPIVLGNVPADGENYKGNNIAFMGQIPVKVMGPVATGDYIVALKDIPGYGIAKSEDEMTIEDYKFAVGRSWEQLDMDGPKMVNTVVGLHNGDYSKILRKMNDRMLQSEAKFEVLESKVDAISSMLNTSNE